MDYPPFLTKAMVADVLSAWGNGRLSNEDIHLWALDNHMPAARPMAPGGNRTPGSLSAPY